MLEAKVLAVVMIILAIIVIAILVEDLIGSIYMKKTSKYLAEKIEEKEEVEIL